MFIIPAQAAVLGASKAGSRRLLSRASSTVAQAHAAAERNDHAYQGVRFCSVRFCNV